MHEKYKFKFDAAGIINDLGGAPETAKLLGEMGSDIKMKAVQKMRERNMMHSDVVATLLVGCARRGTKIDLYSYIKEREEE